MQEVSGSIPLGSTSFADTEAVRGMASGETPEAQAEGRDHIPTGSAALLPHRMGP